MSRPTSENVKFLLGENDFSWSHSSSDVPYELCNNTCISLHAGFKFPSGGPHLEHYYGSVITI